MDWLYNIMSVILLYHSSHCLVDGDLHLGAKQQHPQIRHGFCDVLSVKALSDPAPIRPKNNNANMGPSECKTA